VQVQVINSKATEDKLQNLPAYPNDRQHTLSIGYSHQTVNTGAQLSRTKHLKAQTAAIGSIVLELISKEISYTIYR